MENIHLLISLILFNNAASGFTPSNATKITKSPKKSNVVLIGSKIKLEWEFKFQPVQELEKIRLFRYNEVSKAKDTIAQFETVSNTLKYRPRVKGRYVCNASFDDGGLGSASITFENIQFNHSGSYGILLKPFHDDKRGPEDSVSVKVVDMVANTTVKTIKSWVGQMIVLNCAVTHRAEVSPTFIWLKRSTGEIIKDGVVGRNNDSTLTLEIANVTYFGEYVCRASTQMVSSEQVIVVAKLDYSSPPGDVKYKFNKEKKSHDIYWKQALTHDQHLAKEYIIETREQGHAYWKVLHKTEKLLVSIKDIKSTTEVRICSSNEIGYVESSCSKPIKVVFPVTEGSSGPRGKSSNFRTCKVCILVMFFISSLIA